MQHTISNKIWATSNNTISIRTQHILRSTANLNTSSLKVLPNDTMVLEKYIQLQDGNHPVITE
jgi:hypothetical protein